MPIRPPVIQPVNTSACPVSTPRRPPEFPRVGTDVNSAYARLCALWVVWKIWTKPLRFKCFWRSDANDISIKICDDSAFADFVADDISKE